VSPSCRYGVEDFADIAAALAGPMAEFVTAQPLLLALWRGAIAWVAAEPEGRAEYLTLGLTHFAAGLSGPSAEAVLMQLEHGGDGEEVRCARCGCQGPGDDATPLAPAAACA
jgi:hypothetical protein